MQTRGSLSTQLVHLYIWGILNTCPCLVWASIFRDHVLLVYCMFWLLGTIDYFQKKGKDKAGPSDPSKKNIGSLTGYQELW